MLSGDPSAIVDLRLIIETKRHSPRNTVEVVSEAARWLKAALKGADIEFSYASCEAEDYYGFAGFTILRNYRGRPVSLELKVAEIRETPFLFADVQATGSTEGRLFPFFGDLRSEDSRELLLHYIADFVLSTEP